MTAPIGRRRTLLGSTAAHAPLDSAPCSVSYSWRSWLVSPCRCGSALVREFAAGRGLHVSWADADLSLIGLSLDVSGLRVIPLEDESGAPRSPCTRGDSTHRAARRRRRRPRRLGSPHRPPRGPQDRGQRPGSLGAPERERELEPGSRLTSDAGDSAARRRRPPKVASRGAADERAGLLEPRPRGERCAQRSSTSRTGRGRGPHARHDRRARPAPPRRGGPRPPTTVRAVARAAELVEMLRLEGEVQGRDGLVEAQLDGRGRHRRRPDGAVPRCRWVSDQPSTSSTHRSRSTPSCAARPARGCTHLQRTHLHRGPRAARRRRAGSPTRLARRDPQPRAHARSTSNGRGSGASSPERLDSRTALFEPRPGLPDRRAARDHSAPATMPTRIDRRLGPAHRPGRTRCHRGALRRRCRRARSGARARPRGLHPRPQHRRSARERRPSSCAQEFEMRPSCPSRARSPEMERPRGAPLAQRAAPAWRRSPPTSGTRASSRPSRTDAWATLELHATNDAAAGEMVLDASIEGLALQDGAEALGGLDASPCPASHAGTTAGPHRVDPPRRRRLPVELDRRAGSPRSASARSASPPSPLGDVSASTEAPSSSRTSPSAAGGGLRPSPAGRAHRFRRRAHAFGEFEAQPGRWTHGRPSRSMERAFTTRACTTSSYERHPAPFAGWPPARDPRAAAREVDGALHADARLEGVTLERIRSARIARGGRVGQAVSEPGDTSIERVVEWRARPRGPHFRGRSSWQGSSSLRIGPPRIPPYRRPAVSPPEAPTAPTEAPRRALLVARIEIEDSSALAGHSTSPGRHEPHVSRRDRRTRVRRR